MVGKGLRESAWPVSRLVGDRFSCRQAGFWACAVKLAQLEILQSCCAHAISLEVLARSFKLGRNGDTRACDATKSCSSSGSKGARSCEGLAVLATACF